MKDKVRATVARYSMISENDKVAVAFSGGCDSSALFDVLLSLRDEMKFTLAAVHVNHCLRADESDSDERFVAGVCEKAGIKLFTYRVDVAALARENKESTELAARKARYEIFDKLISDGYKIATAHTASDSAETVLFNLARGTGIKGLCGIPPVRGSIIRPLIDCTRAENEQYCRKNNIPYVTDSTNLIDDCSRNIIRHKVMDVMRGINGSFDMTVSDMSRRFRDENEYMEQVAARIADSAKREVGYDAQTLKSADTAPLRYAVKRIVECETGKSIDAFHVEQVIGILNGGRTRLFDNVDAVSSQGILYIDRNDALDGAEFELKPGEYQLGKYFVKVYSTQNVNKNTTINAIDRDKIIGRAVLRTRRPADGIKLKNRPAKTLKKLLNEQKLPLILRDDLPVIADEQGVIFVSGAGAAERVAADNASTDILIIDSGVTKNEKGN